MSARRIVVSLICLFTALALAACGGSDEEKKKPQKPLQPIQAKVSSVQNRGQHGGHPVIEVRGVLPGKGWTPQIVTHRQGGTVDVEVMAVPGKGAKRGKSVPFTQSFVIDEANSSMPVRVFDDRGRELLRIH